MSLRAHVERLEGRGVGWSMYAVGIGTRGPVFSWNPDAALPSASTAKVLLLIEAARAVAAGEIDPAEPLHRSSVAPVADSGLWQHLAAEALAFTDAAQLVGAVSDNLATNVLLARLGGVEQITATTEDLGIRDVVLHDIVRDTRAPSDPPTLSTGSARGYADLFRRLAEHDGIPASISNQVLGWLRSSADLSMAAAAFGLDPLAHIAPDRGYTVVNKTGTDLGTRADAGIATGPAGSVAYACLARWDEPGSPPALRGDVLDAMRSFGAALHGAVSG